MAAQKRHQGDDDCVTGGVTIADGHGGDDETDAYGDGETDARIDELESALARRDEQLEALIERYEHVLATRERLRRDAGADDGTFVWTDDTTDLESRAETVLEYLR